MGVDMRAHLPLLVLAPLIVCASAQAEFLMLSAPDDSATQESGTPAPHPKPKRRPLKPHVSPAEPALSGFGDQVPLIFAVRQIVPAHFQVAYADGVQQDAPVDWKGGEPWRTTLADAVRPLGLVVTVSGPKVTIAAAPVH
jgi:hypothetical protein